MPLRVLGEAGQTSLQSKGSLCYHAAPGAAPLEVTPQTTGERDTSRSGYAESTDAMTPGLPRARRVGSYQPSILSSAVRHSRSILDTAHRVNSAVKGCFKSKSHSRPEQELRLLDVDPDTASIMFCLLFLRKSGLPTCAASPP